MKHLVIFGLLALVNIALVVWMVRDYLEDDVIIFVSVPFVLAYMSLNVCISVVSRLGVRRGW